MKKFFSLVLVAATALSANAQRTVQGSAFFDNWSIGLFGGATTPVKHADFPEDVRATYGLEVFKQITPVISLGVQGRAANNTTASRNAFDELAAMGMGKINFTNLFCGYQGKPRALEVEGVLGTGYQHFFYNSGMSNDENGWASQAGLNFAIALDNARAWRLNIRPAMYWYNTGDATLPKFDINNSKAEITAGITYFFKNHNNGEHHMTLVRAYDQAEVDGLNAKINDLRAKNADAESTIAQQQANIRQLQDELNECRNKKPVTVVEKSSSMTLEQTVTFRQGKKVIDASQMPNVERIATYLRNHSDAKVVIRGFASPEGSAEINAKIAKERAEAVKSMLMSKYGINANRIDAEGQGVGNMFSEPDWNRVSICTINESK